MKVLLLFICCSTLCLHAGQKILPTDKNLTLTGAHYSFIKDGLLIPQRHSSAILKMSKGLLGFDPIKAQTTTGVVLKFKTDSKNIRLSFKALTGENRGSEFAIYENGKIILEKKFNKKTLEMHLEIARKNPQISEFSVVFPSWSKVAFSGMEIDPTAQLLPVESKKVYVAFGDSISHGTGQGSASYKTWPFILSQKLNLDLYSLAVGGGKVSIPAAGLLKDFPQVDIITLLIGYNDLNSGISPDDFAKKYKEFLSICSQAQPTSKIYCISPLFSKTLKSKKSEHTLEQFRQAVINTVTNFQSLNKNIILIKGDSISSEKNLREDSKDPVHLGISGAKMLADELSKIIK
jgi:lysophospholipase L1-like esterase